MSHARLSFILPLILALQVLASSWSAAAETYYDEVIGPDGFFRPGYDLIYPEYATLSETAKRQFLKQTRADFQGDNPLDPLPRILVESENETLRRGVAQRGTALRLFLKDYFAGKTERFDRVIPPEKLRQIVHRHHEEGWVGVVKPGAVAFPYGPDIIRDPQGTWRVLEDNTGFLGGPGDLVKAREVMETRKPEYFQGLDAVNDPGEYFRELAKRYRALRNPPSGKVVFYSIPPYSDMEDSRLKKLFEAEGIEIVTPYTKKKLNFDESGAWLEWHNQAGARIRQPVGYVALNGEHNWMDANHPVAKAQRLGINVDVALSMRELPEAIKEEIRAAALPGPDGKADLDALRRVFKKHGIPTGLEAYARKQLSGLNQALAKGKVASNFTPGGSFIDDKEFYVYVEDLIREYTGQEPILRNVPTRQFKPRLKNGSLPQSTVQQLDAVFADPKNWVIKSVDGRGGDAVWVGAKIPKKDFKALRKKIEANPEHYIAQTYAHPSVVEDRIADLRLHSQIDSVGSYVSPTPWSRAAPMSGDGKVNISTGGREMAVIVIEDPSPNPCSKSFRLVPRGKPALAK